MPRGFCLMAVVALVLCGCVKKDTPREAATVETPPPSAPPAESNTPAPPPKIEHAVIVAVRTFIQAMAAGDYDRALSLSVSEELTQQGLASMGGALQWDQATFAQAWVGAEQSAVITNPVAAKQGSVALTWAFNLVAAEDGHWLVRLMDVLPRPQDVNDYLAAFREVAPDAKSIEP